LHAVAEGGFPSLPKPPNRSTGLDDLPPVEVHDEVFITTTITVRRERSVFVRGVEIYREVMKSPPPVARTTLLARAKRV